MMVSQAYAGRDGGRTRIVGLVDRLRVARAEQDLSQERLADAAGVSRQTISSIETGQYCPSTLLGIPPRQGRWAPGWMSSSGSKETDEPLDGA